MREQPDFSSSPRPRRPPTWELVAVALGVLALGFALHSAAAARGDAAAATRRLTEVRTEVRRMESRLEALDGRATASGALLTRAAAAGEAPPERIVSYLARTLPDDARIESLTIAYGDAVALDMQVVARDARAWDRTLERLVKAVALDEVLPGPERRDGEVRTFVRARWVGEGK